MTNAPQHKGDTACLAREAELPATILHVRPCETLDGVVPWMASECVVTRICMSARRASSIIVHRLSADDAQPSNCLRPTARVGKSVLQ